MIANGYGVSSIIKYQIVGGPNWMASRAFDINAKVDDETAARWSKMTQPEVDEERRSMTRSLLADRFHLKLHHGTREMSKGAGRGNVVLPRSRRVEAGQKAG
jgi:uncharacterized protein (TIGR03435 family)